MLQNVGDKEEEGAGGETHICVSLQDISWYAAHVLPSPCTLFVDMHWLASLCWRKFCPLSGTE